MKPALQPAAFRRMTAVQKLAAYITEHPASPVDRTATAATIHAQRATIHKQAVELRDLRKRIAELEAKLKEAKQ